MLQFFKFGIIGAINTFLSLAIYYVLVFAGLNYILANTLAFVITVANAYYWNNKYVFNKTSKGHIKALLRVYAAYGITFSISTVFLYIMVDVCKISEMVAPLLNLFITVPLNFIMNKLWAFK